MNDELNNGYNPQNIQNNQKNEKIPEQGNFSASPNNEITTSNVPPTQNRLNSQQKMHVVSDKKSHYIQSLIYYSVVCLISTNKI